GAPGFGAAAPGLGASASGFGASAFGASGAGVSAAGPGLGAAGPGFGAAGPGLGAEAPGLGASVFGDSSFAGAADFGVALAAGLAAFFFGSGAGGLSLTRRTTGASIVELADFTNSPISPRWARRDLLETPSSFASSWTRTLATFLLLWSVPREGADRRQFS